MPRHGMLTWGDVLVHLQQLSAEDLEDTATVLSDSDEFLGVRRFGTSKEGDAADGILDEGHIYMDINES